MHTHTDTHTVSDGTDINHTTRAGHKTRAGSRNRRWFAAIALGAAAFALAACTPVQAVLASDSGSPTTEGLDGSWESREAPGRTILPGEDIVPTDENGVDLREPSMRPPSIEVTDGRLGYFDGCNVGGAEYTIEGGRLIVRDGVQTARGCTAALDAQAEWFKALLDSRPTVSIDGDSLTLSNGDDVLVLEREAA